MKQYLTLGVVREMQIPKHNNGTITSIRWRTKMRRKKEQNVGKDVSNQSLCIVGGTVKWYN